MTKLAEIESCLERQTAVIADPLNEADRLLALAEDVLEIWVEARAGIPTKDKKEGFRLLALHRQGAKGEPSFNACRETCREIAYRYNQATGVFGDGDPAHSVRMMQFLVQHLFLFISGKMEEERLGEFCCSSRTMRLNSDVTSN